MHLQRFQEWKFHIFSGIFPPKTPYPLAKFSSVKLGPPQTILPSYGTVAILVLNWNKICSTRTSSLMHRKLQGFCGIGSRLWRHNFLRYKGFTQTWKTRARKSQTDYVFTSSGQRYSTGALQDLSAEMNPAHNRSGRKTRATRQGSEYFFCRSYAGVNCVPLFWLLFKSLWSLSWRHRQIKRIQATYHQP